jgi:rod shape-determining protein MreC
MRFIYTKAFQIGFAIFVGIALIIIADAKGYLGLLKGGFLRVYGYSANTTSVFVSGSKEYFQTLFTIRELVSENAKLNQRINELSFENARLTLSKGENQALRRSLNFREQSAYNLLPVEVIGSDPTGFTQIINLDKGSSTGIEENSAVVVAPGILVGKITKVYTNHSEATLITDPSIAINAEVTDSGAKGLVRGQHGLGLAFDLVSQNEVIKTSDLVVTTGLSGDFPKGILIGQIDSISSAPSELFQKAYMSPAADLRNLKFLFVIR